MDTYKRNELFAGLAMLGAGVAYLLLTANLPRRSFVDAAFVPWILSGALCLLGVLQLLAWRKLPQQRAEPVEPAEAAESIDYPTVIKSIALVTLFTALLQIVGFVIMTTLYLYAQFIVLTPADQKVKHGLYAVIAVVSAGLIFVIFREGFDLLLPAGLLDF
ncbi:tripartite tricarboxylate transporter TctB family protein [Pseudomonas hefeiensis]|uniref:Tripartite tricarboxylate transporter TctB family protein n=1 Tax=Pseudomonas hefeiensis TaxID=2738125 RepID=A0ABY9GAV4_9PSED|nr:MULTISPECIES: tripartite tricarboxylate transporter TctB family protein [unclassified Pseudomonas]WLH12769.1 tripartite tricarboxylate transporter TctB family protein [Pseudomonas sp. FP205]WLH95834.1 tripartite tricarboxylate transporter TctB family protein [Pseudomonas sp. FP53]WLI40109.1 tripartite tricarboxylate transporter TctB family protein [Pseudomonas sp. FP821]